MDSLATLNVPAIGYGIRYEFGIFDQAIRDGWQVEVTDKWLRFGNPWEIVRSEITFDVKFGGRTEHYARRAGPLSRALGSGAGGQGRRLRHAGARLPRAHHEPAAAVEGGSDRVVRLRGVQRRRLLPARSTRRSTSETISKVLYPNDEPEAGKQLRLAQQYFFVSCSLQDMIRLHLMRGKPLDELRLVLGRAAERHASRPSPSPS